jgi:hypothetical protein
LIVAGAEEKEDFSFPSSQFPRIGVLLDLPKKRILVGPPPLIRSTFTHLVYLNGRYAQHYTKVNEQLTFEGERVVTWKVTWDDEKEPRKNNRSPSFTPQSHEQEDTAGS